MKKGKFILLSITLLTLICTACGGLSKDDAKDTILASYPLPQLETVELNMRFRKEYGVHGFQLCLDIQKEYKDYKVQLQELEDKGYIIVEDDPYRNECNDLYTNVVLTDLGKQYLIKEHTEEKYCDILLSKTEFGEVTEIQDVTAGSLTNANITLKRTYNDFGRMVKQMDPYKRYVKEEPELKRTFVLVKVNDKWNVGNSYPVK